MARFRSIILAGERPGGSPLSQQFDVEASIMVPVAGKPALQWAMAAIGHSTMADAGIICGPTEEIVNNSPDLAALLNQPDHQWLAQSDGPAASAISALQKLDHYPALLTAGDHALLTGEIVDDFCRQALAKTETSGCDFIIGFVPYGLVRAAWPESKRTVLKFSDGGFCGSNLFAVLNPGGLQALNFWRRAEADRKHPWRIAGRFGLIALLRYFFRRLTLDDALQALSQAAGCRVGYVRLDFARAAVDVDSIDDQKLADAILSGQEADSSVK